MYTATAYISFRQCNCQTRKPVKRDPQPKSHGLAEDPSTCHHQQPCATNRDPSQTNLLNPLGGAFKGSAVGNIITWQTDVLSNNCMASLITACLARNAMLCELGGWPHNCRSCITDVSVHQAAKPLLLAAMFEHRGQLLAPCSRLPRSGANVGFAQPARLCPKAAGESGLKTCAISTSAGATLCHSKAALATVLFMIW